MKHFTVSYPSLPYRPWSVLVILAIVAISCNSKPFTALPSPGVRLSPSQMPGNGVGADETPRPGAAFTQTITPNLAHSLTPEVTQSLTPVAAPWYSRLKDLPPGQYLLYANGNVPGLSAIATNGGTSWKLSDSWKEPISLFTAHGRQLLPIDSNTLLDIEQNTYVKIIDDRDDSCSYRAIAPDFGMAVTTCTIGDEQRHDGLMRVYSLVDGSQVIQLERDDSDYYFFAPEWSPDGKWLSVFLGYIGTMQHIFLGSPDAGLYLLDTSCLSEPETCAGKWRGPFKVHVHPWSFSWSPDSRSIAMIAKDVESTFIIFDVQSGMYRTLKIPENDVNLSVTPVIWSPDGEWLACTASEDIFLFSPDGSRSVHLVDEPGDVPLAWFTVPLPMQIGGEYVITQAGVDLNLRTAPSLSASVQRKLHPGDHVTLLEGPLGADGYRWWKMRVGVDGVEGWAVEHPDWYRPVDS